MAFERRLEAVVVGPGKPGQVRVALGRGQHQFVADVSFELLQPFLSGSSLLVASGSRSKIKYGPS